MSTIVQQANPMKRATLYPTTSKPLFSCNLVFPKSALITSITMDRMLKVSSFKGGGRHEIEQSFGGGALEQEALIGGPPSFTTVQFEAALNRTSKWIVTALFVAVVIVRHDATVLWAATGSVVNVLLSKMLKKIINQDRPISALKPDPGMPSSHAQSIFFIFLFAIISLIEYHGRNGITIALSGLTLTFGSYLSWLRVSQKLHTFSQVLVGAAVGSIFSILWFYLWDAFLLDAFNSSLWVRIFIVLGAAGFGVGFVIHVIQHWFVDRK